FCEVDGSNFHNGPIWVAAIGAGDSPPRFTIHSATNGQLFWVTAGTMPTSILYVVDFNSGLSWPGLEDSEHDTSNGNRLLSLVKSQENGYSLGPDYWIGVKRPNIIGADLVQPRKAFGQGNSLNGDCELGAGKEELGVRIQENSTIRGGMFGAPGDPQA